MQLPGRVCGEIDLFFWRRRSYQVEDPRSFVNLCLMGTWSYSALNIELQSTLGAYASLSYAFQKLRKRRSTDAPVQGTIKPKMLHPRFDLLI
jgi:hypothetical protein